METELLEVLGIWNGLKAPKTQPPTTQQEIAEIERLAVKLTLKTAARRKEEDLDESISFDVLSHPRKLLYEGDVGKKSNSGMVTSHRRHLFLLSDVLLVTSLVPSDNIFKSAEKYSIHQVLQLNEMSILDPINVGIDDNPYSFILLLEGETYTFITENESEKHIWMEEMTKALCTSLDSKFKRSPGSFHDVFRGTLHSAAFLGELSYLRFLIRRTAGAGLDELDQFGMSPLHWAAFSGHKAIVDELLASGCCVDLFNTGLNTALMVAAARGHAEVLDSLLNSCADISFRNMKDRDALWMAALYGSRSKGLRGVLQSLILAGCVVDDLDASGCSILHECCSRNLAKSVHLLLELGAHVNSKHGRTGLTPMQLCCCVAEPDAEVVRALLDRGAHPNWRDSGGRTSFELIIRTQSEQVTSGKFPDPADFITHFIQFPLPALMEIVRKGGRYSEDIVAHLRPSFRDAINSAREYWIGLRSPDRIILEEVWHHLSEMGSMHKWTANSASKHCLMCLDLFTVLSNRRHHCRSCGVLCCALCSSKRMPLPVAAEAGEGAECRVCDGCFNKLSFDCAVRQAAVAKARRDHEKAAQSNKDKLMEEKSSPARGKAVASAGLKSAAAAGDAKQALLDRGQRIQDTAEKAEQMNEAASEYNKMARNLLKQQQKSSSWL